LRATALHRRADRSADGTDGLDAAGLDDRADRAAPGDAEVLKPTHERADRGAGGLDILHTTRLDNGADRAAHDPQRAAAEDVGSACRAAVDLNSAAVDGRGDRGANDNLLDAAGRDCRGDCGCRAAREFLQGTATDARVEGGAAKKVLRAAIVDHRAAGHPSLDELQAATVDFRVDGGAAGRDELVARPVAVDRRADREAAGPNILETAVIDFRVARETVDILGTVCGAVRGNDLAEDNVDRLAPGVDINVLVNKDVAVAGDNERHGAAEALTPGHVIGDVERRHARSFLRTLATAREIHRARYWRPRRSLFDVPPLLVVHARAHGRALQRKIISNWNARRWHARCALERPRHVSRAAHTAMTIYIMRTGI
jgi:hypothetical protein